MEFVLHVSLRIVPKSIIYLSPCLTNKEQEPQVESCKFASLFANVRLNYVSGNTESLNYVGNNGTCDLGG